MNYENLLKLTRNNFHLVEAPILKGKKLSGCVAIYWREHKVHSSLPPTLMI